MAEKQTPETREEWEAFVRARMPERFRPGPSELLDRVVNRTMEKAAKIREREKARAPSGGPCSACRAWREFDPWPGCSLCGKPVCEKCAAWVRRKGGREVTHVCGPCRRAEVVRGGWTPFQWTPSERRRCMYRNPPPGDGICGDTAVEFDLCARHLSETGGTPPPKPRATCTVSVRYCLDHGSGCPDACPFDMGRRPCGAPVTENGVDSDGRPACAAHTTCLKVPASPRATCTVTVRKLVPANYYELMAAGAFGAVNGYWHDRPCGAPAVESGPWGAWCREHWLDIDPARREAATFASTLATPVYYCGKHALLTRWASECPMCADEPREYAALAARQREGEGGSPAPESPAAMAARWMPDDLKRAIWNDAANADPHGPPDPSPLAAECGAWVATGRYCNTRVSTLGAMCEACFKKYDALEPGERPKPEGSEPDVTTTGLPFCGTCGRHHGGQAGSIMCKRFLGAWCGCVKCQGRRKEEYRPQPPLGPAEPDPLARECLNEAADARELAADLHDRIAHLLEAGAAGHRDVARFFARQPKVKPPKPGRIARARAWVASGIEEDPVRVTSLTLITVLYSAFAVLMGYDLAIAYGLLP